MIEVQNLVKMYGSHAAVDHLSFTVDTGKVVGFLGPNGAGKSTTMNMITGYIAPTEGKVLIDGVDMEEEPGIARKNIGYLPEIPALYPDLRVREYLMFVAELKKVPSGKRGSMVKEIMERTQVKEMSERLIRHLSKGYKQRTGLAAAMMGYPDILILDEPTVGLDPKQILQMRELIRELAKEHTVLLSSHIMQEISAVCDEIIIINEGKMIACDTPENLTKQMSSAGLHLIAKGAKAQIKNALRTVAGIRDVVYDEVTEEGTLGMTLYSLDEKDLREDIFFALAEASCPILELHREEMSLEQAFLALTKNDAAASGDSGTDEDTAASGDTRTDEDTAASGDTETDKDTAASGDTGTDKDTAASGDTGTDKDTAASGDTGTDDDSVEASDGTTAEKDTAGNAEEDSAEESIEEVQ